ncbi:chromate transporter [Peptoniphilaceae bacterium SGI.137]|nr:chromate transporter [Peptoniphilaceae bacterium]MDY5841511.1 chromate transporter [Peptoniphilaceae bacterium]MDY6147105.1 chromate transporter [Peptoniphilaceae bacterium]
MSILLRLFFTFLKIGAFAFGGGYAVLPLITQYVVEENGWLTVSELTDLVSLSQMTPGPIAINSATFIGTKVAGLPGAVVATLGNVLPQLILMMALGYLLFSRSGELKPLEKILKGLKPAIVGLVAIATIQMMQSSLFAEGSPLQWSLLGVIGLVVGLIGYGSRKLDVIQLVVIAAVLGAGFHAVGIG